MAIEIAPKSKLKKISYSKLVLYLCFFAFFVLVLSYFFLLFYEKKLADELSSLEVKLSRSPEEASLEKEVVFAGKQIADFKFLLSRHFFSTRVFDFFEQSTHPRVWFPGFSVNLQQGTIVLEGKADSFEVLGQQLLIFEKHEFVKQATMSNVLLGREGDITFKLQITFDPASLR